MFVKICGIAHEEDALVAVALGADALGFVFAPGSPRQITGAAADRIMQRLPRGTTTIGVFRDERPERIIELVNTLGLSGVQLHGREPLSEVRWIRQRVPLLIQAFHAGDPAVASAGNGPADVVMLDAPEPGSGRVFDWTLAEGVPGGVRFMLAGGLNAENVADAIFRVRPWGVDVSTGVETAMGSGRKDPRKLQRFIEEAKDAGEQLEHAGWNPPASTIESVRDGQRGGAPYDWQAEGH